MKENKTNNKIKHMSPAKRILILVAILLAAGSFWAAGSRLKSIMDENDTTVVDWTQKDQPTILASQSDVLGDVQTVSWSGWQTGRVSAASTDMLAQANTGAAVVTTLHEDDRVLIIGQVGSWYRLRSAGYIGWAHESTIVPEGERTEYGRIGAAPEITDLAGSSAQSDMDAIAQRYQCVGATVAVIKNGEVSYTYEYGWANRGEKVAMTADTKLRIASATKVFLAMTAMSMRDMQLVDLDADVSDYLGCTVRNPKYPDTPITLRNFLTHTSSLIDFGVNILDPESLYNRIVKSKNYEGNRPGTVAAWKYNNTAICAAGAALEKASGKTLVEYTRNYFFEPLGVDASLWAGAITDQSLIADLYRDGSIEWSVDNQIARPYYTTPGENFAPFAGDLTISAKDMARLLCILINDGQYNNTFYLYPDTVAEMETSYFDLGFKEQCIVLSYQDDQIGTHDLYYHNGNAYGVFSYVSYEKETGNGVVVITSGANTDDKTNDSYVSCVRFAQYCYDTLLGGESEA